MTHLIRSGSIVVLPANGGSIILAAIRSIRVSVEANAAAIADLENGLATKYDAGDVATEAEAVAGQASGKLMSALRVKQAFDAFIDAAIAGSAFIAGKLSKAGGVMTGDIGMAGRRITGIPDAPTGTDQAVNAQYVITGLADLAGKVVSLLSFNQTIGVINQNVNQVEADRLAGQAALESKINSLGYEVAEQFDDVADRLVPTQRRAALVDGALAGLPTMRRIGDTDVVRTPADLWGTGIGSWGFVKRVTEAGLLDSIVTNLQDPTGTAALIRSTAWILPANTVNFPVNYLPPAAGLLGTRDTLARDVLGPRRNANDFVRARVALPAAYVDADAIVLVALEFLNGAGVRVDINPARAPMANGEPAILGGIYKNMSVNTWFPAPAGFRGWAELVTIASQPARPSMFALATAARTSLEPAASNRWMGSSSWRAADNFREWAVAVPISRAVRARYFAPIIFDANLASNVLFYAYRRPATAAGTEAPGAGALDQQVLAPTTRAIGEVVADATSAGPQEMRLPVDDIGIMEPGWIYMFGWVLRDANNAMVGCGLAIGEPTIVGTLTTWFTQLNSARSPVASSENPAYTLYVDSASTEFARLPTIETVRAPDLPQYIAGRSITVPTCEIARPGGSLIVRGKTFEITDIAAESLANEFQVRASSGRVAYLSRKDVNNVIVTNLDTDAVMNEGPHYTLNRRTGRLDFAASVADGTNVEVTFTGYKRRYDQIYADANIGELAIVEGVARGINPEDYLPATPANTVAVYNLLVTPGRIEVIPVHRFRDMVEVGREGEFAEIVAYNRERLPELRRAMATGGSIGLVGYGDSQTEIISRLEPVNYEVPNVGRDGIAFFEAIPADTLATIPRFATDGASNPAGPVIHVGWCWALKAAIERTSGAAVSYLNLGLGGSRSNSNDTGPLYGGGDPRRLNAAYVALDAQPPYVAKLAAVSFGMNELGQTATFPQVVNILQQLLAHGIKPIVVTVPGTNLFGFSGGVTRRQAWEKTNDALVRAARYCDCPFVPFHMVTGYGKEGALGISRESFSTANGINHDGPYVYRQLGRFMAKVLIG